MNLKKLFLFKLLALFLLASPMSLAENAAISDFSQPIAVRGSAPEVVVRLASNPTTGYSWSLTQYDPDFIEPLGSRYYAPQTDQMGAPGYVLWRFKLKEAAFKTSQKTAIVLEYRRPWEPRAVQKQTIYFVTAAGK